MFTVTGQATYTGYVTKQMKAQGDEYGGAGGWYNEFVVKHGISVLLVQDNWTEMCDGEEIHLSEKRFDWSEDRNVCTPIRSFVDVQKLKTFRPPWQDRILQLSNTSSSCYSGQDIQCHRTDTDLLKQRRERKDVPKTLFCHDLRGGYREDRQVFL